MVEEKDESYLKGNKRICLMGKSNFDNMAVDDDDMVIPVVDEVFTRDLPTIKVYVATITDPKDMSKYIREIYNCLPFPCLQHLKRVKNKDIILSPVDIDGGYPEKLLEDKGLIKGLSSVRIEEVSSTYPRTRRQFDEANKLWPVKQFNEDKDLEKKLASLFFTEDEKLRQKKFMRIAVEAAKRSKVEIGAVVVDPSTNELLAVAGDGRSDHPVKHAAMVAIDLVARMQGGGVWPIEALDFHQNSSTIVEDFIHKKRNLEYDSTTSAIGPYLCTGYDLYITSEPCTMCAMALLHSRIRRVFYGCPSNYGALGTLAKVHTLQDTNHRFEVFSGLLKKDCLKLSAHNVNE